MAYFLRNLGRFLLFILSWDGVKGSLFSREQEKALHLIDEAIAKANPVLLKDNLEFIKKYYPDFGEQKVITPWLKAVACARLEVEIYKPIYLEAKKVLIGPIERLREGLGEGLRGLLLPKRQLFCGLLAGTYGVFQRKKKSNIKAIYQAQRALWGNDRNKFLFPLIYEEAYAVRLYKSSKKLEARYGIMGMLQNEEKLGRNEENLLETNFLYSLQGVFDNNWGDEFIDKKVKEIAFQALGAPLSLPSTIHLSTTEREVDPFFALVNCNILFQKECCVCHEPLMLKDMAMFHLQDQHKHSLHYKCLKECIRRGYDKCPLCRGSWSCLTA